MCSPLDAPLENKELQPCKYKLSVLQRVRPRYLKGAPTSATDHHCNTEQKTALCTAAKEINPCDCAKIMVGGRLDCPGTLYHPSLVRDVHSI